eukprot:gene11761-13884_t
MERLKRDLTGQTQRGDYWEKNANQLKDVANSYHDTLRAVGKVVKANLAEQLDRFVYPDPTPLLKQEEREKPFNEALDKIDGPALVIRWLNHLLKQHDQPEVANLGSDLKDGKELLVMYHSVFPEKCSLKMLEKEVDPLRFINKIERSSMSATDRAVKHGGGDQVVLDERAHMHMPEELLAPEDIMDAKAEQSYQVCAHMFQRGQGMDVKENAPLKEAIEGLEGCIKHLVSDTTLYADSMVNTKEVPKEAHGCPEMPRIPALPVARALTRVVEQLCQEMEGFVRDAQDSVAKANQVKIMRTRDMQTAVSKVQGFALDMLSKKAAGLEVEMTDDKELAEIAAFTTIHESRIKDLLPKAPPPDEVVEGELSEKEQEIKRMEDLLLANLKDVRRIYKFYAAGGCMSSAEYWKFLKDCKIPCPHLNGSKFDMIFYEVNQEFTYNDDGSHLIMEADDDNPDNEMMPKEFMEALIVIASKRFKGSARISTKFKQLLGELVLPNACTSDQEEFRNMLNAPEVRDVMNCYRDNLRKVFAKFSGADKTTSAAAASGGTMNMKEVIILLKECRVLGAGVDNSDVKNIFGEVQDNTGNESENAEEDESELVFTEFIEFMATCCIYKYPNPYKPLHKRLDQFFGEEILKPLAAKLKLKITRPAAMKK